MGRRRNEEAALRALARKVWGDEYYERYFGNSAGRRRRLGALGAAICAPLLLSALGIVMFSTAAFANTSTITISCTEVSFAYHSFPNATPATAHETVTVDGTQVAVFDFAFIGPTSSHTIPISIGAGSHTVVASVQWSYSGKVQGHTSLTQTLSNCVPDTTTTTTTEATTTTTVPESTTTTTVPESTTTTTEPESTTTTTEATTTTTNEATTTTTVPESTTTTTEPETSTTIEDETTTTLHTEGSTSTTTTASHEEGSTSPTTVTSESTPTTNGNLPFTGSNGSSAFGALAALGVGSLAVVLSRRRGRNRT